jgi:hypothetical protein
MRRFNSAALALMMIPGSLVASSTQTLWEFAPYSWVKRIPAEKGVPANGQPFKVDAATLAQALSGVRLVVKTREEPLFLPAEVAAMADVMAEALSLAQPGEDLQVLSTMSRGRGMFTSSKTITARVFVVDGKLNLIVHDARLEFLYYATITETRLPLFEFGSRAKASEVSLKDAQAEARRADWLVLPLTPVVVPAPMPVAGLAPTAQPQSPRGATIEEHLRDLKRFRDQNLITEDEFNKEKQDLLKAFTSDLGGGAAR